MKIKSDLSRKVKINKSSCWNGSSSPVGLLRRNHLRDPRLGRGQLVIEQREPDSPKGGQALLLKDKMTKPLPRKVKSQRELMRKRENAKLASEKKRLEKDRQIRQRRLEIEERQRLLREHKWHQASRRREQEEEARKRKQQTSKEGLDARLQKKKRFFNPSVEKKTKRVAKKRRVMKVRGRGVTLSRLFGGN